MAKAKPKHTDETWVLEMNEAYDRIDSVFYFYDGELPIEAGYVKVPRGNNTWAQRLLMNGYQWVGGTPEDFSDVR